MKLEDAKVGMKVWVRHYKNRPPESGTIIEINPVEVIAGPFGPPEAWPSVEIKWDKIGGTSNILLSNVYLSIEELQQGEKKQEDKKVVKIKTKIHNVEDLIVFIYNAYFFDLDPSCTKRVIHERTKEFFGLDCDIKLIEWLEKNETDLNDMYRQKTNSKVVFYTKSMTVKEVVSKYICKMYHATLNGDEYTNYNERRVVHECEKEFLSLDLK